jgi:hypothetical protein
MRWLCLLVVCVAGCASTWDRHRSALAEAEARGDDARAAREIHWQIDNAFLYAPAGEQTPAAEAKRYLRLAKVAAKKGKAELAVEALREALATDPHQSAAVRAQLDHLPVSAAERDRLTREFNWNIAALSPHDESPVGEEAATTRCWSYQVHELRIRHRRTVKTTDGMQHQVTYDARPWAFDVNTHRWYLQGDWVEDAGAEAQLVSGPDQPRYQAVTSAEHEFYTDDSVPPCHRDAWQGPYDEHGSVFVATRLPASRPASPQSDAHH